MTLVCCVTSQCLVLLGLNDRSLILFLSVVNPVTQCKLMSMFLTLYIYVGPILTDIFPPVRVRMTVTISVLKTQVKMGSPSSQALTLRAYSSESASTIDINTIRLTTKSSRKLVIEIALIVTNGILRSKVVETRPSLACETRK